jgi:hypothetical protein
VAVAHARFREDGEVTGVGEFPAEEELLQGAFRLLQAPGPLVRHGEAQVGVHEGRGGRDAAREEGQALIRPTLFHTEGRQTVQCPGVGGGHGERVFEQPLGGLLVLLVAEVEVCEYDEAPHVVGPDAEDIEEVVLRLLDRALLEQRHGEVAAHERIRGLELQSALPQAYGFRVLPRGGPTRGPCCEPFGLRLGGRPNLGIGDDRLPAVDFDLEGLREEGEVVADHRVQDSVGGPGVRCGPTNEGEQYADVDFQP